MYIIPHACTSNRVHIPFIEIPHLYIEPNTHTSKLQIQYKWYRTNKSKCFRTHRNNPFIPRTVLLCSWACLYEVLNRENFYINRNFGQPVSSYTSRDSRRGPLWAMRNQLTDYEVWDLLVLSLEANLSFDFAEFFPKTWWFQKNT